MPSKNKKNSNSKSKKKGQRPKKWSTKTTNGSDNSLAYTSAAADPSSQSTNHHDCGRTACNNWCCAVNTGPSGTDLAAIGSQFNGVDAHDIDIAWDDLNLENKK